MWIAAIKFWMYTANVDPERLVGKKKKSWRHGKYYFASVFSVLPWFCI
jgi:hypothetical protein